MRIKNRARGNPNVESKKILLSTKRIETELKQLNSQNIIQAYNSVPKLLSIQLLKGIAFGLGSVIGATIIVSVLAYLLSQMEFIPIVGEWVKNIIEEIQK